MLVTAHIKIAKQVRDVLSEKFNLKISLPMFTLGSIFPDFNLKTCRNEHNFFDVVSSARRFVRAAPHSQWARSFGLGIVCHYTTDSFCDAHIRPAKYSVVSHFLYEMRGTARIRRQARGAKRMAQLASYPTKNNAISGYIAKYRDYIKASHSYEEECTAAVQNSVLILSGIA